MEMKRFTRRDFLKTAGAAAAVVALGNVPADLFASRPRMAKFP
ncbi:MAG: twin-arginine translocation signal domain-containing protein [Nitrospirae bacterium]|nr:twin-arginine translocation signal domain-containing protein [Nitrospirota bacterium]